MLEGRILENVWHFYHTKRPSSSRPIPSRQQNPNGSTMKYSLVSEYHCQSHQNCMVFWRNLRMSQNDGVSKIFQVPSRHFFHNITMLWSAFSGFFGSNPHLEDSLAEERCRNATTFQSSQAWHRHNTCIKSPHHQLRKAVDTSPNMGFQWVGFFESKMAQGLEKICLVFCFFSPISCCRMFFRWLFFGRGPPPPQTPQQTIQHGTWWKAHFHGGPIKWKGDVGQVAAPFVRWIFSL